MTLYKNKFLMTVAAVALTLAVGACSSSSDDDNTLSAVPDTGAPDTGAPDTGALAPLSELATAKADAAAAATDAMTASSDAADAAAAAMTAVANLATMQTGATAGGLAYEAHTAAGKAMMAYMDAKAASEAAAEAEEVTAAVEARIMAEEAKADAVKYAKMASDKGTAAETEAMAELMINGKDKNVGETALNADDGSSEEVTNGQSVITGRMKSEDPTTRVDMVDAVTPVEDNEDTADMDETVHAKPAVAAKTLPISRRLDSSDDMARLMLVTSYAGSKKVGVFIQNDATETNDVSGTDAGSIDLTPLADDDQDESVKSLKSVGMYYLATDADNTDARNPTDIESGTVANDAETEQVYSYVSAVDSEDNDVVVNVVRVSENDALGTTTYTYQPVSLGQAKVDIPEATDYQHIHFGVWAALGEAAKNGSQEISNLGIGFVQNYSGEGLTTIGGGSDDMPNGGMARYDGNWVATVQADDSDGNGAIRLDHGAATLTANFGKGEINALLTDLATLSGAISGNEFSGTKASAITHADLDTDGTFTGSFSGGFYGNSAAEAGGIFDFTSKDLKAGAFRGAFGGDKE